jgi:hypothetical protein
VVTTELKTGSLAALAWTRPLGLTRMARDLGLLRSTDASRASHRSADAAELLAFNAICRAVADGDLGDLPLAVATSTRLDPNHPPASRAQHARNRFYPTWTVLQRELAGLSANNAHIVADHAGTI